MADSYLPCLKCKALVPEYVKEIHATECHVLKLRSFTHPRISGFSLHGQALIVGKQAVSVKKGSVKNKSAKEKNTSKLKKNDKGDKNEKTLDSSSLSVSKNADKTEEPDWLKKILPGLSYRIAVISELDMLRCDITAYTPVLVEHSGSTAAFIAVPDSSIRIGHVMLHTIACMQYFPSLSPNALIWVKKIDDVRLAREIVLYPNKPLSEEESRMLETHMKTMMFSTYPLGAPFTLKKNSVIYPTSSDVTGSKFFTVIECKSTVSNEDHLLETFNALNIQDNCESNESSRNEANKKELLTEDHSLVSSADHSQGDSTFSGSHYITLDEYHEGDSLEESETSERSFVTSTPNRKNDAMSNNLRKSVLISENLSNVTSSSLHKESDSSRLGKKASKSSDWVRVGKDTKIVIKQHSKRNLTVGEPVSRKDVYCRDSIYFSLVKILQNKLANVGSSGNPFLCGWNGVLLYGPPGTGKTLLVSEVAHTMNFSFLNLSLTDVIESSGGGSDCVRQKFKAAVERAPSVLFIDEIDSLCPIGEHRVSRDKDLTRAVISGIQQLKTACDDPVFLIAATSRVEAVSPKLRCSGRFDKEILVPLPNAQQRSQILLKLMSSHRHHVSSEDITWVARQAYGYSGADLNLLIKCAWYRCVQRHKSGKGVELSLGKEDLQAGMEGVLPTMLRQDFQAVTLVKWSDIKGYEGLKSKLQKMVQLHIAEPESNPLKGLLLYGPPGCSKTMFVKALVNETSFSFFPVKCSNLLSKYVGETEKSLVKVFERARQAAPSIIFMDEVDSLCGDRLDGSGLVSELLSLMSENALRGNILVIGATNRPHVLDEALLKPGCLEQVIHIDLPDYQCRHQMWSGLLEKVPTLEEIDVGKLSEASGGYSGAEITGVYQHAAQSVLAQYISEKENQEHEDSPYLSVSEECLLKSMSALPPRTPSSLLEKIKEFSNRRCSSSEKKQT